MDRQTDSLKYEYVDRHTNRHMDRQINIPEYYLEQGVADIQPFFQRFTFLSEIKQKHFSDLSVKIALIALQEL